MIVGRSIHNQRIERLWRDVFQGVLKLYYGLFHHLESIGYLDPDNEVHRFCLQYVYVPRINCHLAMWKDAWNVHPVEEGTSILAHGNLDLHDMQDELFDEVLCCTVLVIHSTMCHVFHALIFQALFATFGVDWDGPPPDEHDVDRVVVPQTRCPLSAS